MRNSSRGQSCRVAVESPSAWTAWIVAATLPNASAAPSASSVFAGDRSAVDAGPVLAPDVLDLDAGRRHLESCVVPRHTRVGHDDIGLNVATEHDGAGRKHDAASPDGQNETRAAERNVRDPRLFDDFAAKTVTHAVMRLDEPAGIRGVADCGANIPDQNADVCLGHEGIGPDQIHDLGLREHARTKLDQQTKQVECFWRQRAFDAARDQLPGGEIQMRIAEPVKHY